MSKVLIWGWRLGQEGPYSRTLIREGPFFTRNLIWGGGQYYYSNDFGVRYILIRLILTSHSIVQQNQSWKQVQPPWLHFYHQLSTFKPHLIYSYLWSLVIESVILFFTRTKIFFEICRCKFWNGLRILWTWNTHKTQWTKLSWIYLELSKIYHKIDFT